MDNKDFQDENAAAVLIVDRRTHRQAELSSSDVMRILRSRAAKALRKKSADPADDGSVQRK